MSSKRGHWFDCCFHSPKHSTIFRGKDDKHLGPCPGREANVKKLPALIAEINSLSIEVHIIVKKHNLPFQEVSMFILNPMAYPSLTVTRGFFKWDHYRSCNKTEEDISDRINNLVPNPFSGRKTAMNVII